MEKTNQKFSDAVIVGAGLAGSLLAIFLRQKNYKVTIIEKRPDMRKAQIDGGRSINLVVTSRGIHALSQVGLLEQVLKITVPVYGRMIHDLEGSLRFQPYGKDESECNYSVSRSELNILLMNEAEKQGAKIIFDAALEKIDFAQSRAIFNGGEMKFDLLIGADGAGSVTRSELLSHLKEVQAVTEDIQWIDSDYKELSMPLDLRGNAQMEAKCLHIWPRGNHMLMGLPNLDGSFTMTAYLPKNMFHSLTKIDEIQNFFNQFYSDALGFMPSLVEDFLNNPRGHLGTVRCFPWSDGHKVLLIGDAAHSIVPFFGQGMNASFEDCSYLMKYLNESEDLSEALNQFQNWQKPSADAIADMALENFIEMRDKVGSDTFLLRKKIDGFLEKEFPQKYRTRYAMVTYTLAPYVVAQKAGIIQSQILDKLCANLTSLDNLDLVHAEKLIDEMLVPFFNKHKVDFN